ncbi:hypothetical protein IEQ34_016525 [Dendrobium chrysotoxum]|uniref:Uncharacterized protein n=1 Tax=Dendrobium chrysotoxum TaxID=161865 RepID=A0AAV7GDQ3_DENCH|nr:hypothetical protein IEQ34_016525 [Dendrobium chrysotoxum]
MKKLAKIWFNASDIKNKQPELERCAEPLPVPEETSDSRFPGTQPYVTSNNIESLRIRKCKNTFFISETRFSSNGPPHSVMISFENGGIKMHVKIDGRKIYTVDITKKVQGNEELNIDGMVVDFVWYLNRIPLRFLFYTRESSSHAEDLGSSSHSDGPDSSAKDWNDHKHIYLVHILGD